jgi:hypothetical protein
MQRRCRLWRVARTLPAHQLQAPPCPRGGPAARPAWTPAAPGTCTRDGGGSGGGGVEAAAGTWAGVRCCLQARACLILGACSWLWGQRGCCWECVCCWLVPAACQGCCRQLPRLACTRTPPPPGCPPSLHAPGEQLPGMPRWPTCVDDQRAQQAGRLVTALGAHARARHSCAACRQPVAGGSRSGRHQPAAHALTCRWHSASAVARGSAWRRL